MKKDNKQLLDIAEIIKRSFDVGFNCGQKTQSKVIETLATVLTSGDRNEIMDELEKKIFDDMENSIGTLLAKYLPKTNFMQGDIK